MLSSLLLWGGLAGGIHAHAEDGEVQDDSALNVELTGGIGRAPAVPPEADDAETLGTGLGGEPSDGVGAAQLGEVQVSGPLSQSIVQAVITRYMNPIRHCYRQALSNEPGLAGEVVVTFDIGPDGRVSTSTVASSTMSSTMNSTVGTTAVGDCINEFIQNVAFPLPREGGTVSVQVDFSFTPE